MSEREFEVLRIVEIGEAVAVIADNKYLDGTTSYRSGRLGDFCKSIVRTFSKQRDRFVREARDKERKIKEKYKNGTPDDKIAMNDEIVALSNELNDQIEELGNQLEKIKVPLLKLSDFIAKADIVEVTKDGESKTVIKSGQSLVPVKFFTLMGDVITDDKNAISTEN